MCNHYKYDYCSGHNQNGPLEDGAVLNLVPAALVAAGAKDHTVDDGATTISGEYCVIDHTPPGIPEETERDDNGHTQTTESRRSPQDLQRTQCTACIQCIHINTYNIIYCSEFGPS